MYQSYCDFQRCLALLYGLCAHPASIIVLLGVRMPYCETVQEFADVLAHEVDAITPIPPDR